MGRVDRLLDAARKANPGEPEGTVRHVRPGGDVLVTWKRASRLYDVGTESNSLVYGRRSEVLPVLERLIANPEMPGEVGPRPGAGDLGRGSFDAYAARFDYLAGEMLALVAEDTTGGGYVLLHMREAADEVKGGQLDEALASLDAIEGHLEEIREQIRDLARGEPDAEPPKPLGLREQILREKGESAEQDVIAHFSPDDPEEDGGPVVETIGGMLDDGTGDGTIGPWDGPGRLALTPKGKAEAEVLKGTSS